MANEKKEITKSERKRANKKEEGTSITLYSKVQTVIDEPRADNADKPIKKYNRNKIKYICNGCGLKVWGKSGLSIHCNECDEDLEEETE